MMRDRKAAEGNDGIDNSIWPAHGHWADSHCLQKEATNYARDRQRIEEQKSKGEVRSKTVDGLPKCEIAVQKDAVSEVQTKTRPEAASAATTDVAKLARLESGVGEPLERTLDRAQGGALDTLPADKRAEAHALAETALRAMLPKVGIGGDTPKEAFFTALEKQSPEMRAAIAEAFRELSGTKMEDYIKEHFSGDDQEKALNYLKYGSRDQAASLHLLLNKGENDKVRLMIETMNSNDIAQLDKDCQDHYGKSLHDLLLQSDDLNPRTKQALEIYIKGADFLKAHPDEWNKLIDISLGDTNNNQWLAAQGHTLGDLQMFKEIMAAAPPEVREKFLANGGKDKIELAFTNDKSDATEYAKHGHLSLAAEIHKNIGFWSDDHDAILKACDETPKDERDLYIQGARAFHKYWDKLDDFQKVKASTDQLYAGGRKMSELPNADQMSEDEKKAYAKYLEISAATIEDRPWNDEKGQRMRDHVIYSGGSEKAVTDLDQLSWDDLQKLKSPDARQKYFQDHNIDLMSDDAQKQISEALERRLAAQKKEDLKYADGQSLESALEPGVFHSIDPDKVLDAIQHMSLKEQEDYRTNKDGFKDKIDRDISNPFALRNAEQWTAARHMLDSVYAGKPPEGDFIDKIHLEGGKKETDETQVIRLVEQEFRKSELAGEKPTLHERLTHPRPDHPEDEELKERLDKALHSALDADEYEKWAKPVLEHGRLSIEEKLDIDQQKGDNKSKFIDIQNLASAEDPASCAERYKLLTNGPYREQILGTLARDQRELAESMLKHGEERHRILTDPSYQKQLVEALPDDQRQTAQKVLSLAEKDPLILSDAQHRDQVVGALEPKERQIAQATFNWDARAPEDAARSFVLGVGSKEQMLASLKDLSPEQIVQFRDQYALKYHGDVVSTLSDKLSGDEKTKILEEIRIAPVTAREALQDANETVTSSNSGVGATFTRWWGSGAGDVAADRILQLQAKIEQASAEGKEFSVEEAKKLADDAREYTQLFETAKEKAADELADLVVGAASFIVPGGMSLRLLLIATGGGLTKLGLKEAIAGHASVEDFVSGFVSTGLNALGPGEIAGALHLGEEVAVQAGKQVAAKGGALLAEGVEQKLTRELKSAAANAFAHGGGVIEDKVLNRIAKNVAREGATDLEKAAVRQMVEDEFKSVVEARVRSGIKDKIKDKIVQEGLSMGAAFGGGFAGGVISAGFQWDGNRSFSENMGQLLEAGVMSGVMGVQGALVLGNAMKLGGKTYHMVFGKASAELGRLGAVATEGQYAIVRPENAPAPKGKPVEVASNKYSRVGGSDYYVSGEGKIFKKVGDGAEGRIKLAEDASASIAVSSARPQPAGGYLPGDQIALGGERYNVAGFDPETGGVIVRQRGYERRDRVQLVTPEELAETLAGYRKLEIEGKDYYCRNGKIVLVEKVPGSDSLVINPRRDLSIRTREDLASSEFIGSGELRRMQSVARFRDLLGGPEVGLTGMPDAGLQPGTPRVDQRVFFGGRELDLTPGQPVTVGRSDVSFGSRDIIDAKVSEKHGTLGLDQEGRLVYTDHSDNGTFVKRPGGDNFEVCREGQTTYINPGDEVRLGSEFGPELKHYVRHGQTLSDGSVVFKRAGADVWHRPDGLVISDRAGTIRFEDREGKTLWVRVAGLEQSYSYLPNGRLSRIEYSDGRVAEFTEEGKAWTFSKPGRQPEHWSGDIEVNPDGSLTYAYGVKPAWRERLDGTRERQNANGRRIEYSESRYDVERTKLSELAEYHFQNPKQRARFESLMAEFEQRVRSFRTAETEIAATYHQINRLIQAGDSAPLGEAERLRLAEQVLHQAAAPTKIDQGGHRTCNVTTVEKRIFTRQPSEAARLIADVATTGSYVTADGAVVNLERIPGGLKPDEEALRSLTRPFDAKRNSDIRVDERRTYASQLLQNTAVNIKYAGHGDDVTMYEMHYTDVRGDTGERLMSYRANPDGSITRQQLADHPAIGDSELVDIHNRITGRNDEGFVIHWAGREKAPEGKVVGVGSGEDLASHLEKMREIECLSGAKQFPLILVVYTNHPPFSTFLDRLFDRNTHGRHVINIQGFRRRNGRMYVEFSNQWGIADNRLGRRAIPVEQLFEATKPLPTSDGRAREAAVMSAGAGSGGGGHDGGGGGHDGGGGGHDGGGGGHDGGGGGHDGGGGGHDGGGGGHDGGGGGHDGGGGGHDGGGGGHDGGGDREIGPRGRVEFHLNGKIRSIEHPNGQRLSFTYDTDTGELNSIGVGPGTEYVTVDGFNWFRKTTGTPPEWVQGKYELNQADGSLSWQEAGTRKKLVKMADGTQLTELAPILPTRDPIEVVTSGPTSYTIDKSSERVLETVRHDGIHTSYEYEGDKLARIVRSDGTELSRHPEGDCWITKKAFGGDLVLLGVDFEVDAQGTLWRRDASGTDRGSHLDGSETVTVPGKGMYVRNSEGLIVNHVTVQDTPRNVYYDYDNNGELNEVRYSNGMVVHQHQEGLWNVHDSRHLGRDYFIHGKLAVSNDDGALIWEANGSAPTTIFSVHEFQARRGIPRMADPREQALELHRTWPGTRQLPKSEQSSGLVVRDNLGRVSQTVAYDGQTTMYSYGPGAREMRIALSSDVTVYTVDGNTWYRSTPEGEKQLAAKTRVSVDEKGTLTVQEGDGRRVGKALDGYSTVIDQNGNGRRIDPRGRTVEIYGVSQVWELSYGLDDRLNRIKFDDGRFAYLVDDTRWGILSKHPLTGLEKVVIVSGDFDVSEFGRLRMKGDAVPADLPQGVQVVSSDGSVARYPDPPTHARPNPALTLDMPAVSPDSQYRWLALHERWLESLNTPSGPGTEGASISRSDGKVTRTVARNGKTISSYVYDRDGNLVGIERSDGMIVKKLEGQKGGTYWHMHSPDGHDHMLPGAQFAVDKEDGTLSVRFRDGRVEIDDLSGSKTVRDRSGNGHKVDGQGKVIETYREGRARTLSYGADGHLDRIRLSEDSSAFRIDENTWGFFRRFGHDAPGEVHEFRGSFQLAKDGTLEWRPETSDHVPPDLDNTILVLPPSK